MAPRIRPGTGRTAKLHSVAKPDSRHQLRRSAEPDPSMRAISPEQVFKLWQPNSRPRKSIDDARMSVFPKPYADRVARLRVTTGFLLAAAFAWFSQPDVRSLAWGFQFQSWDCCCAPGPPGICEKEYAPGGWRPVRPRPQSALSRDAIGRCRTGGGLAPMAAGGLFALVFVLIYLPAIELEEQHLGSLFPDFAAYAQRVPGALADVWKTTPHHRSVSIGRCTSTIASTRRCSAFWRAPRY